MAVQPAESRPQPRGAVATAALWANANISAFVVYIGFLALFVFFAVTLSDKGFLTAQNMMTIARQMAPVTIMAA